jgi:microsomal dipeptidase-like Zn-dependent dipeptidase
MLSLGENRAIRPGTTRKKRIMVRGFADIHNHQHANLGFGGNAFWGGAFGPIDQAVPECSPVHGWDGTRDAIGNLMKMAVYGQSPLGHHTGGNPYFAGWPRWDSVTHQSVYEDWLHRAVEGGLRLMVMLAVNNEYLAGLSARAAGRTAADMEAVDLQLQAAKDMEASIDARAGGPGLGWYRIVYSPAEARVVMAAGKLAVVLGIEVDYLFGCHTALDLTTDQVRAQVDSYFAKGVRHMFPIHFGDNGFGGTAFQNGLEWDDTAGGASGQNPVGTMTVYTVHTEPAASYEYRTGRRNTKGLTTLGNSLISEMIAHGMVIDIDHMSARSKADTLTMCEAAHYPVVAGHVGFVEISNGDKNHEGQLLPSEVERIRAVGGMVGVILHQGDLHDIDTWRGSNQTVVDHISGNTSNTMVQAYMYAVAKMMGGPVAFGTDYNGFAGLPGPRYGPDNSPGGKTGPPTPPGKLAYPFTALATGAQMGPSVIGQKTFTISDDGPAHVGMLPDLIAEYQAMGLTAADLDPLMSSAEGYVTLWEKAYNVAVPSKRISDGTLLQDETGSIYVVEGGARFHVPDMPTFTKLYNAADVHHVPATMTAGIPTCPVDGTLLAEANGAVHVICQGARFHVPDPATFDSLYSWANVRQLWDHAIDQIPLVPKNGTLLRETNGAVHVVYGGARFHVPDPATFNALFNAAIIHQLWDHAVDQIPMVPADGSAFQLGAGGPIWVVRGGKRSPAPAGQLVVAFELWPGALDSIPQQPIKKPVRPI